MAISGSSKRSLIRLSFCIIFVFLEIVQNCCARTTTTAYMNRKNKVDMCPQNKTEWQEASRRLNCSDDAKSPFNRYHCLPVYDLTTLMEFCYNQTRPQVVKGTCMIYVQGINSLNGYKCTAFDDGCPDMFYHSDESYKFPACLGIDPIGRCYVAESSCRSKTTPSTNRTFTFATPTNRTTNNKLTMSLTLFLPYLTLLLLPLLVSVIYIIIRRECKQKDKFPEEVPLLKVLDEKTKAEIANLGLEYILDKLPADSSEYSLIAKELKISVEILFWTKEKRGRFVERMKDKSITVYSGRGMVIGCARAGKTTLVKKLKGEKDLRTQSTSGIEIHPHVFKLDPNKNTIIPLTKEEKQEELFCLTQITLDQPKKKTRVKPTVSNDNFTNAMEQKTQNKTSETSASSGSVVNIDTLHHYDERTKDRVQEHTDSPSGPSRRNSNTFYEEAALLYNNTTEQQIFNIESYTASVKEEKLMMLSLLDFAGHSAYYACHHIFISPRVFFILVVDMLKDLNEKATQACTETDLIYSDWTYAEYIRYWFGSIHTYSSEKAPVILVASHSEEAGKKVLDKFYKDVYQSLPKELRGHICPKKISVEKKSKKGINDLKEFIASTIESLDHWGENVPLAWNKLEYFLGMLRKSSNIYSFSDLQRGARTVDEIFMKNKEELITALEFFNDTGLILFRNEIENENKNAIILDVQWFVNAFKCIIMDKEHLIDQLHYDDFDKFYVNGLLSSELLNTLWKNSNFYSHKSSLVKHMIHLDMLAELEPETWYVPCMNKQKYNQKVLGNCSFSSTLCFVFKFLPSDIYHRLISACINKLKMELWTLGTPKKYCIYHGVTILQYKNTTHRLIIGIAKREVTVKYPYSIEIQAIETEPNKPNIQFCSKIKEDINRILLEMTCTFKSSGPHFEIGYSCSIKLHMDSPQGKIILEDVIKRNDRYHCNECSEAHWVDRKRIFEFWEEILLMPHTRRMSLSKYESTRGTTHLARIARALFGPCIDVLREVLAKEISPPDLERKVKTFIHHKKKPSLSKQVIRLVYGKNYSVFDVTLLYFLLCNMCSIPPHNNNWGNDPELIDKSVSANIERIRILRNEWYGHATDFSLSDSDFEHRWNHIFQIVKELEGFLGTATKYQDTLIELKSCFMDPDSIQLYIDKLLADERLQTDVINLKEGFGELQTNVTNLKEGFGELQTNVTNLKEGFGELQTYVTNLKEDVEDLKKTD